MSSEIPRKRETTGGPRGMGPAGTVAAAKQAPAATPTAPPTSSAGQHSMASSAARYNPKMAEAAAQHSTETLHQSRKFPGPPVRMALGGFVAAAAIGYFVLYTKKKPDASVTDVAKIAAGVSEPQPETISPRR